MSGDPRLPELFEEAVELPEDARAAWLAELGTREPALAREIEELLAAAAGADPLEPFDLALVGEPPPAPERIGPYRIRREIGLGGMARVFLAEHEGEGFRRRVALKVVDRPLLGEEAVRRFRDEVRILAALEHPGIARFLDGGRSAEGIPFLALEFVEGADLLAHSARLELGVEERVRLFLAVVEAVAYAHGKGVVHRDLKPANILVAADGGPRLLDFGISKVIAGDLDEATPATRTDLRVFTPAYASPEQFHGDPVTPAVDVYSLGVILYELLAGVHPYRSADGSRGDLQRAVLDRDPEPPSSAARRSDAAPAPDHAAMAGEPATGNRQRRGRRTGGHGLGADLDAICLKALRKEPADRYPTAAAMAADLRRYLEGQPVLARRGGRRYRAAKLLRRNSTRLSLAASVTVAALALAFAASVRRDTGAPVGLPAPSVSRPAGSPVPQVPPVPPALPTDLSAAELSAGFAAAPGSLATGAALAIVLAREGRPQEAMAVVGRMRQVPGAAADPLADFAEANIALGLHEPQRALLLATSSLERAERASPAGIIARIRATRARALSALGRRDEARRELARSVTEAEASGDRATLARNLNDLAVEEAEAGDLVAAERRWEAAAEASRGDDGKPWPTILENLAVLASERGRPDLAEPRLREVLASFRELGRPRRVGAVLTNLSACVRELGRAREAAALRAEALPILEAASNDTTLAVLLLYTGEAAIDGGELGSVARLASELEATAHASGDLIGLGFAETLRGRAAAAAGELTAARRHLIEARRLYASAGNQERVAAAALALAEVELAAGTESAAAALAGEVAARHAAPPGNRRAFRAAVLLARVDLAAGRLAAAEGRLAALSDGARRPAVAERAMFVQARAALAAAGGRRDQARRDLEAAAAATRAAELVVMALGAEVELARLAISAGDADRGAALATAVAAEADRRGLASLAASARAVVASAGGRQREARRAGEGSRG